MGATGYSILFLCLARNCERTLPHFFSFLAALEAGGFQCSALIGENGSGDRTRELIQASPLPQVKLVDTSAMAGESSRLLRMAKGRQMLLNSACSLQTPPDLICVADLDNVMTVPPSVGAMRASADLLREDDRLFAVGATSFPVFYDLIALRAEGHDYAGLHDDLQTAKQKPLQYFAFHEKRIYANQRRITQEIPLRCRSSFNGLCMYNAADYCRGTYIGDTGASICEHVILNEAVAEATGKQMLISAELRVQAPADHVPVSLPRFWLDRLRKARKH